MQVQQISTQNFGMALKCEPKFDDIQFYIATKLDWERTIKSDEFLQKLTDNNTLTKLYISGSGKNRKLEANVGNKIFKENWFNSPYRVLKKALKESNKLDAKM